MKRIEQKSQLLARRKRRVRRRVFGTTERPRMTVFRSLKHIYAQIINDEQGVTLCSASSLDKQVRGGLARSGNRPAAAAIGKLLAERAKGKGITQVAMDRNGRKYHGRLKALADAAREGGLQF